MKLPEFYNGGEAQGLSEAQAEANDFLGVSLSAPCPALCECGRGMSQRFAKRATIEHDRYYWFSIVRSWSCKFCKRVSYGCMPNDPMLLVTHLWNYPRLFADVIKATCQTTYQYKFWEKHLFNMECYPTDWLPETSIMVDGKMYFLDFYNTRGTAIELDGDSHLAEGVAIKDYARTKDLESVGIKTVRLWA